MIGLAVGSIFIGFVILVSFVAFELGYAQAESVYQPIVDDQARTIDSLLPSGVTVLGIEEIEPGSREDLFNRADPGCELCEGAGHVGPAACPCTEVEPCR